MFQHATIALAAAAAIVVGIGSGCATPAPTVRNYMTPEPTRNNQLGNADLKLVLDPTLGDKDVQCSMLAVEVPVNETLAFRRLTSDEMIMVQAGTGILTVDAKQIPVNPGEQLNLDKQNGRFSRQQVQADLYKSWTEGRLEYDKITLEELAVRLSRKYDVQIHLDDQLEKETVFRVSLRNEETVSEVIHALSEIIPIRYKRDGRNIYIRKQ